MDAEDRAREEALEEALARAQEEISRLERRLSDERFAQELKETLTLAAAAGQISAPVTHSRLLEMIVETAASVIPSRAASLFLIDQETEELIFEVALGPEAEEVRKFRVPLGQGIAGLVAVSGQPMAISDASSDPRQATDIAKSVGYTPGTILCVPLIHNEVVIGVLELLDREGAPSYAAADMATSGLFANQAAVAIEQSRNQQHLAALLGEVLRSLGGVPEYRREGLEERARTFAAGVEEGPSHGRALELATLVSEISRAGEEESRACLTILRGFAEYLRSRPEERDDLAGRLRLVDERPAWSAQFAPETLPTLAPIPSLDEITPEWAWGGSAGEGVKVAVIDSGIDADHPAVRGGIGGYVAITDGPLGLMHDTEPHGDSYGHGTACAGIIRSIASGCELYSVKVLGSRLTGRGTTFAAGIQWAIENGMEVANISMGTTKKNFFGALHNLVDRAYFQNTMLITAANNMPVASFPSLYASVISVASHEGQDPYTFYYNPQPPVEFGAPGIDVRVAWAEGGWITATGNSFAAPHVTGIVARILGKHPNLTLFQMKTILRALSANMTRHMAVGQES